MGPVRPSSLKKEPASFQIAQFWVWRDHQTEEQVRMVPGHGAWTGIRPETTVLDLVWTVDTIPGRA